MKSPSEFSGVWTALVSPFRDGALDQKSFLKLIAQQIECGVSGVVINGTTGESPTLTLQEVRKLVEWASVEIAGEIPFIIGAGSNSTDNSIGLVKSLESFKPAAFLQVVPYYNKPPQRGLVKHFTLVAEASDVPTILYNVPSRTISRLEPETIGALAKHENIAGIKEATGDMELFDEIKKRVPKTFSLLSGDDATCVDFVARGGHGVISVCSHIIGKELVESIKSGDRKFAKTYATLLKYLYIEANPIPVKMALHWMGILESPELRSPLVEMDGEYHEAFQACLKELEKI